MNKEAIQWIDWNKYVPECDLPLLLKTEHGIRQGYVNSLSPIGGIRLTDCTHPLQNCHLSFYNVIGWCYADPNKSGKIIVNHWARQKEGEEILKSINTGRVLLFKRIIKRLFK